MYRPLEMVSVVIWKISVHTGVDSYALFCSIELLKHRVINTKNKVFNTENKVLHTKNKVLHTKNSGFYTTH